jgi:ribosomal protein S18 acetylase RimI-like enzyme
MTSEVTFGHYDSSQTQSVVDTLVALYIEIYAHEEGEFFGESRIRQQLESHMQIVGFDIVMAFNKDSIIGFVYGFPLASDTRWWRGLRTTVSPDLITESGGRTFAISELAVHRMWRRQGIGRALHDQILTPRTEDRATLLVEQDNEPANNAYAKWGWKQFGRIRPARSGAPTLDALMLSLPLNL